MSYPQLPSHAGALSAVQFRRWDFGNSAGIPDMIGRKKVIMYDFESMNKNKKTVRDEIKTEGMNFVPLKDFIGKEIHVDGFFFSEGKYGRQAVVVGEGCKINLPKRYTKDWEQIRDNDDALKAVLEGHLILTDIKPVESDNGKSVAYSFKNA